MCNALALVDPIELIRLMSLNARLMRLEEEIVHRADSMQRAIERRLYAV